MRCEINNYFCEQVTATRRHEMLKVVPRCLLLQHGARPVFGCDKHGLAKQLHVEDLAVRHANAVILKRRKNTMQTLRVYCDVFLMGIDMNVN